MTTHGPEKTPGPENISAGNESAPHVPVLLNEVLASLAPKDGGVYLDATFGAGGYTRAILAMANCQVIALDRDRHAIAGGFNLVEASGGRLTLIEDRFSNLANVVKEQGFEAVDGIVMDVGVSSMQLDQAARGFSFRQDGPLDMRMGHHGPSAADIVAAASLADLTRIIAVLGEEKFARPVARAIVAARDAAPVTSTSALSAIISHVVHQRFGEIHPATRTFQALRIFVNEELDELQQALIASEQVLTPGGRLVVVSFHSLEDRIVKTFMADRSQVGGGSRHRPEINRAAPSFTMLNRRPVVATADEISGNPRSRSAKLRAVSRTDAPAHRDEAIKATLPSLADVMRGG